VGVAVHILVAFNFIVLYAVLLLLRTIVTYMC